MGKYIVDAATGDIIGYTDFIYDFLNSFLSRFNKQILCNIKEVNNIVHKKFVLGSRVLYTHPGVVILISDRYKYIHNVYLFLKLYESLVCDYLASSNIHIRIDHLCKGTFSNNRDRYTPKITITQELGNVNNTYTIELLPDKNVGYRCNIRTGNNMMISFTGSSSLSNGQYLLSDLLRKGKDLTYKNSRNRKEQ